MMRLLSKKQTYMEDGCMLDNMLFGVIYLIIGLFSMLMSFYILLCFIQWISDVVDEKRWLIWMEWFKYDN